MGATHFTGPIIAGNVIDSDGSGVLAGAGGFSGVQNTGYVNMVQAVPITQATNGASAGVYTTTIVIPAQSMIIGIKLLVQTAWTGGATTLGIGTTASATALTTAGAVAGGTAGLITITPGTDTTAMDNWRNTGSTDIMVMVTSTNTGSGAGVLMVEYAQSINI